MESTDQQQIVEDEEKASETSEAPAPENATEKPRKKKRSPVKTFFKIVFYLILLLIILGVVGYYLVKSGRVSYLQIAHLGSAEIGVVNLGDGNLDARLIKLDTEDGSPYTADSLDLESFGIGGFGGIKPGRYTVELDPESSIPPATDCTLTIKRGGDYQFVVVPAGISVVSKKFKASSADDLIVDTSPLCE